MRPSNGIPEIGMFQHPLTHRGACGPKASIGETHPVKNE